MALAWLIDPEHQFMTKSGTINVGGMIRIFDAATDDPVVTYKDFVGTANTEAVILDNNGRACIIADSDRAYRVEVYDRYNSLLWTVTPVWCMSAGGGVVPGAVSIISSDGSVRIVRTSSGGISQFDLSVDMDDNSSSVIVVRSSELTEDGTFQIAEPVIGRNGTDLDIEDGQLVAKKKWYHFVASVEIEWDGTVVNRETPITVTGPDTFETVVFDLSYPHIEYLTVAGDYEILTSGNPISFAIQGMPEGMSAKIVNASVHAILLGVGSSMHSVEHDETLTGTGTEDSPLGVNTDNIQEKLTSGDNITIVNNVISATASPQLNSDWDATSGVQEILNKPDLSIYALAADLAPVATTGSYDDLTNKPDIPAAQVNSDWDATSGVQEILNKPDLSVFAKTDDLAPVATTGDYDDLVNKPVIPAAQVNSDWDAVSGVEEILNKPDLSVFAKTDDLSPVATTGDYDDLVNKPVIPEAQVNSDWDAVSGVQEILNKPDLSVFAKTDDLAPVATSGSYNDLTDKPEIVGQVNSDWDATSGVAEILNKPVEEELVAGDNIVITDNGTTLTISATGAPQLNADWDATSGVQEILNKPTLAAVATSGSYTDLTNTPTITDLLPSITGHGGDILAVNSGATGVEWVDNESNVFYATYNSTTIDDILAAYNNGKAVFVKKVGLDNTADVIPLSGIHGTGIMTIAEFRMPQITNSSMTRPGMRVWVNGSNVWSSETSTQLNADWNASSGVTQILNKPTIPAAQVNSDWDATSGVQEILNKPQEIDLVAGANITLTESNGILTIAAAGSAQVNADWDATSGVSQILNKPDLSIYAETANLATVATSGSYTDLSNKPTIPAAQVNSDWNSTSGVSEILNKPTLSTVATTGAYSDLSGTPDLSQYQEKLTAGTNITIDPSTNTISATAAPQVNSDWDATSGVSEILNKPSEEALVAGENITITDNGTTLTISAVGGTFTQVNADWDATSGVAEILNKPSLATVATTGAYSDLSGTPDMTQYQEKLIAGQNITIDPATNTISATGGGAAQVNSDWDATSGVAEILNKPDLVDIVAGPGIVVDNPDGNTLRVSTEADAETVLWDNTSWLGTDTAPNVNTDTISEAITHFSRIRVYFTRNNGSTLASTNVQEYDVYMVGLNGGFLITTPFMQISNSNLFIASTFVSVSGTTITETKGSQWKASDGSVDTTKCFVHPYKIVGIHRIANN